MAYRMKKPPMRIVVSIVAVLLVAVMVPLSTAFADGMNGMIGGGEKKVFTTEDGKGFYYSPDPNIGPVRYSYHDDDYVRKNVNVQLFTADVIGEDYNQFVITANETPNFDSEYGRIRFKFDPTPSQIIEEGYNKFVLTLSSDSDQRVRVITGNSNYYTESTDTIRSHIVFIGIGTEEKCVRIPIDVTCNDDSKIETDDSGNVDVNIIAGETTEITYTWDKADMIRAVAALQDCNVQYMNIYIYGVANDPLDVGEMYSFNLFGYSEPVNGYAISNIFVGILGVSLIVGAVFATPWVGQNTFSKDGRIRRAGRRAGDYLYEWNYRRKNYDSKDWAAYKVQKRIDKQKRRESRQRRW